LNSIIILVNFVCLYSQRTQHDCNKFVSQYIYLYDNVNAINVSISIVLGVIMKKTNLFRNVNAINVSISIVLGVIMKKTNLFRNVNAINVSISIVLGVIMKKTNLIEIIF
jgi:hypothetical protein